MMTESTFTPTLMERYCSAGLLEEGQDCYSHAATRLAYVRTARDVDTVITDVDS